MPEEININHEYLAEFLPLLADDVLDGLARCMGKGLEKWVKKGPTCALKPEESSEVERARNYITMSLQMGLLLAKKDQKLGDVALSFIKSQGVSVDEIWQVIIDVYQSYLEFNGQNNSESERIHSKYFEDFLTYYATLQLREIFRLMDKEWKKGWKNRKNPFKLKPGEKAKLVSVGNRVTFLIFTSLLIANKQPELLQVDWPRGASLDVLWQGMMKTYQSFIYFKTFVDRNPI